MNTLSKSNCAALWMDQAKAILLIPDKDEWELVHIFSYLEARHRSTGGKAKSRPYMHESGPFSAAHHERHQQQKREAFFADVREALGSMTDLLLLGSGPTAGLFHKSLLENTAADSIRITRLKCKELSPPQLKKKAREFFGWPDRRKIPLVAGQVRTAVGARV